MLTLSVDQTAALQALSLARGTRRIERALSDAFPDLAQRAGERLAAVVAQGVQRGREAQLHHAVCLARYLACWFVWGPEFENRAGFEWALAIVTDDRRHQGAKAHQLCRRTEEELRRLPPRSGQPGADAFRAAVKQLDDVLADAQSPGWLVPGPRLVLGQACDIDAIDVSLVQTEWRREYALQDGRWTQVAEVVQPAGLTLTASDALQAAPALPDELAILSLPPGGAHMARLRVRTRWTRVCDDHVHPLLRLNGPLGMREWRGPAARDVTLALHAQPDPPSPAHRSWPVLAFESTPERLTLDFTACGLRDSGAPVGELVTQLVLVPASQWLLAWQHEPSAPPSVRLERDGAAQPADAWELGLIELDRALASGLQKLGVAWERESGVRESRATTDVSTLVGASALTFGWKEGAGGLVGPAAMRARGHHELLACRCDVTLAGLLELQGSAARIELRCRGETALQGHWERNAAQLDWVAALAPARTSWRYPFELSVAPIAGDEACLLGGAAAPTGALVGECGLRLRGDGPGLQWFARLAIEPATASLQSHSALLGRRKMSRPLLPAMTLLDWSLG
jgi:hypothetical protein